MTISLINGNFAQWVVLASIAVLSFPGCQKSPVATGWKSSCHPVNVNWKSPWIRQIATDIEDSQSKLLQSFINREASSVYLLTVTPDVPATQISDESYRSAVRAQQLSGGNQVRLLDEGPSKLHGLPFYRMRFAAEGTKGPMCTSVFIRRDGTRAWTVLTVHPRVDADVKASRLPEVYNLLEVSLDSPN